MNKIIYDLVGIGIGPANLGLAALSSPIKNINCIFFDKKPNFSWHGGVTLKDSNLQVHYLKDLVTLVDPTNQYSFLSFLSNNNRIYQFLNQNKSTVSRKEYEQYYQWVSKKLTNLKFNHSIDEIKYEEDLFKIRFDKNYFYAKNISIGVGKEAYIPSKAVNYLSEDVLHSSNTPFNNAWHANKVICIVGSGQSAAEVIYDLINSNCLPKKIFWINKRYRYLPLEDACFSNEYYTPSYAMVFYKKDRDLKNYLSSLLNDTNNGITLDLLNKIYHKIYELRFIENSAFNFTLLPAHLFVDVKKNNDKYQVYLDDILHAEKREILVDKIIFSTGYKKELPNIISSLVCESKIQNSQHYEINPDFSISWEHENTNKIYLQNSAENFFGLGDTNLGIFTWRNSVIINSVSKKQHYRISDESLLLPNSNE